MNWLDNYCYNGVRCMIKCLGCVPWFCWRRARLQPLWAPMYYEQFPSVCRFFPLGIYSCSVLIQLLGHHARQCSVKFLHHNSKPLCTVPVSKIHCLLKCPILGSPMHYPYYSKLLFGLHSKLVFSCTPYVLEGQPDFLFLHSLQTCQSLSICAWLFQPG